MPKGRLDYRRGDIYWVTMDPTVGAEVQKTRSCLILQNNVMNQYGDVTIILPFRPGSKQAPYAVNVKASPENGHNARSLFGCRSNTRRQLSATTQFSWNVGNTVLATNPASFKYCLGVQLTIAHKAYAT